MIKSIASYLRLQVKVLPLLVIFYIFYMIVIDYVYWSTGLTIQPNEVITNEKIQKEFVDYRLTQILIFFIVSSNLLILSKLPTKFINAIFFAKRFTSIGIDFVKVLNFYSTFYLVFGFVLVLLLAFIKGTLYVKYVIPFHYLMLAIIPIYLIHQANKKAKDSV